MASRQDIGAKVSRGFKQVGEFDFAVASNARYWGLLRSHNFARREK